MKDQTPTAAVLGRLIDRKLLTGFLVVMGLGVGGGYAIPREHSDIKCMTQEQGEALTQAIRDNAEAAKANSNATTELAKEIAELRGTINGRRGR